MLRTPSHRRNIYIGSRLVELSCCAALGVYSNPARGETYNACSNFTDAYISLSTYKPKALNPSGADNGSASCCSSVATAALTNCSNGSAVFAINFHNRSGLSPCSTDRNLLSFDGEHSS